MSPLRLSKIPTFKKTKDHLDRLNRLSFTNILKEYGSKGVLAISQYTPVDTGVTANSWDFKVTKNGDDYRLSFTNNVIVGGVPLVILLQYGHGTRNGGYVVGRDFINPALDPIYSELKSKLRMETKNG